MIFVVKIAVVNFDELLVCDVLAALGALVVVNFKVTSAAEITNVLHRLGLHAASETPSGDQVLQFFYV